MAKDIAVLKECGVPFKVMNRAEIVATEPRWRACKTNQARCNC